MRKTKIKAEKKLTEATKEISKTSNNSLSPKDRELLESHMEKRRAQFKIPEIKIKRTDEGKTLMSVAGKDEDEETIMTTALLNSFGTTSGALQSYLMKELVDASCSGGNEFAYDESSINGILAAMHGIAPKDEIESMLACQMVATHFMAMKMMRNLKRSNTIQLQDCNGNMVTKLLRTYTSQMEALNRYRGKGQQKVTVEHVHVHEGGQAIVGNIEQGVGVANKKQD